MVDSLPNVFGHYAMFSKDVTRERELCFKVNSVCKHIKNFEKYCKAQGINFVAYKKLTRLLKDVNSCYREWKHLG